MDRIGFQEKANAFFKKYRYVLLVLLLGVVLMSLPEREEEPSSTPSAQTRVHEDTMEQRLEEILAQIDGAGKVRVLLTEQTGESISYQTDDDLSTGSDTSSQRRDTVIITNAEREEQGLIQQVNPPVYLGAVVVCQGADRATVRLAIVEAVSNATGLGADKISVLKMK